MKSNTIKPSQDKTVEKKQYNPFIDPKDRPRVYMADGTEVKPIHGLKIKMKKSKRVSPFNAKTFDLPK